MTLGGRDACISCWQTIPQGNGAYKMSFSHTFQDASRAVRATILGGAHNGRSSYAVWADP